MIAHPAIASTILMINGNTKLAVHTEFTTKLKSSKITPHPISIEI